MRRCHRLSQFWCHCALTALLISLASGCATTGEVEPVEIIDPLEQNAVNAIELGYTAQALVALDLALTKFERLDDLDGQWRILHAFIVLFIEDDKETAASYLPRLTLLAKQLPERTFTTNLLAGRLSDDEAYFRAALDAASNDSERALAYAYLGETLLAVQALEMRGASDRADRAFIYFAHAKATADIRYYKLALSAFREAGDGRGVSDSLFAMAKIEKSAGNLSRAAALARRAERSLRAMGDEARAAAARDWGESM